MVDRVHRELTDDDLAKIAGTYHAWRGDKGAGKYADVPGFCKAAKLDDIRSQPCAHAQGATSERRLPRSPARRSRRR